MLPPIQAAGAVAASVAAVMGGAEILRVHDVRATVRAVRLAALIRDAGGEAREDDRPGDRP